MVWLTAAAGHGEKESLQPAKNGRMSRPSQPTSLSAGHYSSSQPESRQAKERRKAGSLQSCLLLKELEKGLQPAFCMLLSSVDRSVGPWTYHGPHGGRTNERADIHGNDACDGGGGQKKASVVHPEAFLESRAGSSNGVSGPRLLLPPLLLTVARSSSLLLLLLWLVSSRRDHGGLSTQSGRQTGSAAIDFCP